MINQIEAFIQARSMYVGGNSCSIRLRTTINDSWFTDYCEAYLCHACKMFVSRFALVRILYQPVEYLSYHQHCESKGGLIKFDYNAYYTCCSLHTCVLQYRHSFLSQVNASSYLDVRCQMGVCMGYIWYVIMAFPIGSGPSRMITKPTCLLIDRPSDTSRVILLSHKIHGYRAIVVTSLPHEVII